MVIRVMVEGGVINADPSQSRQHNAMIQRNSAALRESLNVFFCRALGIENVEIKVSVASGYKAAAKLFLSQTEEDFLYADLDDKPENRKKWFEKLAEDDIVFPDGRDEVVCFWIPEMEAWFLKQPESLELWAKNEHIAIKNGAKMADDNNIKGKDIEHLQHKPSDIVNTLFSRYLVSDTVDKRGKPKKLIYGKLRHAPGIIACLDAQRMIEQDGELSRFVALVKNKSLNVDTDSYVNKKETGRWKHES